MDLEIQFSKGKEAFQFPNMPDAKFAIKDILEKEVDKKYTLLKPSLELLARVYGKTQSKRQWFWFRLDGLKWEFQEQ
ncbi:MAG: hypothetical protein R2831_05140 [Chitinophagaceae bacterium]